MMRNSEDTHMDSKVLQQFRLAQSDSLKDIYWQRGPNSQSPRGNKYMVITIDP